MVTLQDEGLHHRADAEATPAGQDTESLHFGLPVHCRGSPAFSGVPKEACCVRRLKAFCCILASDRE